MLQTKHSFGIDQKALNSVTRSRKRIPRHGKMGRWFTEAWKIVLVSGQTIYLRSNRRYCRVDLNPNDFGSLATVRQFLTLISNVPAAVSILRVHFNIDAKGVSPYWALRGVSVPRTRKYRRFSSEIDSFGKSNFTLYYGSSELEQIVIYNVRHRRGLPGNELRIEARLNTARIGGRILIPERSLLSGPDAWRRLKPFQGIKVKTIRTPVHLRLQKVRQIDHYLALTKLMGPKEAMQHLREIDSAPHRFKRLLAQCTKPVMLDFDRAFRRRVTAFLKARIPINEQRMLNVLMTVKGKRVS